MGKFVKTRKLALLATTTLCLLGRARRRKSLKSCWVRSWLSRRERHGMSTTLVRELETEDTAEYRSMFRMNKDCFELLLQMISQSIVKQDTRMRQSVSPKERLQVTLRYLATGRVAYRLHDLYCLADWRYEGRAYATGFPSVCRPSVCHRLDWG